MQLHVAMEKRQSGMIRDEINFAITETRYDCVPANEHLIQSFSGFPAGQRPSKSSITSYGFTDTAISSATLATGDRRLNRRGRAVPDRTTGFFRPHFSGDQ